MTYNMPTLFLTSVNIQTMTSYPNPFFDISLIDTLTTFNIRWQTSGNPL